MCRFHFETHFGSWIEQACDPGRHIVVHEPFSLLTSNSIWPLIKDPHRVHVSEIFSIASTIILVAGRDINIQGREILIACSFVCQVIVRIIVHIAIIVDKRVENVPQFMCCNSWCNLSS